MGQLDKFGEYPGVDVVGLVCPNRPTKGLARDCELVEMCLTGGPARRRGFPDPQVRRLWWGSGDPWTDSRTGANFGDWLKKITVAVVPEQFHHMCKAADSGVRTIWVPNADWTQEASVVGLGEVEVWAKTPEWLDELRAHGAEAKLVPWIDLGPVTRSRAVQDAPVRVFVNVGDGGYLGRRGTDLILEAWSLLDDDVRAKARLAIKATNNFDFGVDDESIEVVRASWSRGEIEQAYAEADVVLAPSRWEGFGLTISEALNAGCPVITTDAWPMNEQVVHGHNGLAVKPDEVDTFHMAPCATVDGSDLAEAMERLIIDDELRRRLTCPQPGQRIAKQHAFRTWVRAEVMQESKPRALVVTGNWTTQAMGKRSELWWADSILNHGFEVDIVQQDRLPDEARTGADEYDFALLGKTRPSVVEWLRSRWPEILVLCWHHDLTDASEQRATWQNDMVSAADACFVSEGDLDRYEGVGEIHMVHSGHRIADQRPPYPGVPENPEPVFVGTPYVGHRVDILSQIPDLVIYGPKDHWQMSGLESKGVVSEDSMRRALEGQACVCTSWVNDRENYTSVRLWNVMAAGGIPIVERFPGLETLVKSDVPQFVDDVSGCICETLLLRLKELRAIQLDCVDEAWRFHTYDDMMGEILGHESRIRTQRESGAWDSRASEVGRRAVGHIADSDDEFETRTAEWWQRFEPHITDGPILDYGCGVGRFTRLISSNCTDNVVGLDQSAEMLSIGAPDCEQIEPGARLPFYDDSFRTVFTSTVLQHIPDVKLPFVLAELRRVSTDDARWVIFENVHQPGRRTSLSGHVVFRSEDEWQHLMPWLKTVWTTVVRGERHALMVGDRG